MKASTKKSSTKLSRKSSLVGASSGGVQTQKHYLFIMKNNRGDYFLAGQYCTMDNFIDILSKRHPRSEIIEAAHFTEVSLNIGDTNGTQP